MDYPIREELPSKMVLTEDLVRLCERREVDPGPKPDLIPLQPSELDALAEKLLNELGNEKLWLFAYGSLIWKNRLRRLTAANSPKVEER